MESNLVGWLHMGHSLIDVSIDEFLYVHPGKPNLRAALQLQILGRLPRKWCCLWAGPCYFIYYIYMPPNQVTFFEAMWRRSFILCIEADFVFFLSREYERDYGNDSWIPIAECTDVSVTQCDITEDISATVPYNLRVRASMGTEASLWATLNGFFNRVTSKSPVRKSHNPAPVWMRPVLILFLLISGPATI